MATMKTMTALITVASLTIGSVAGAAVAVSEAPVAGLQTNLILEGNFNRSSVGGPPLKPWQCSKNTEKVRVGVEKPAGRPEVEKWTRLVDDGDAENANIRQSFAPVKKGRFLARLISNKDGGRLFFNLGTGSAAKPEERALQLSIETDGALQLRGQKKSNTSMRIKTGEVYLVRCDFEPINDGKALQVLAELVEEDTQLQSRVEMVVDTTVEIATLRVTSTRPDTGVDYYVTDFSLVPQ